MEPALSDEGGLSELGEDGLFTKPAAGSSPTPPADVKMTGSRYHE